jgi:hypothetical protein
MFKRGETTNTIQKARIRKARYFFEDRNAFMLDLYADIQKAIRFAERKGLTPVFRLNGTSDLSWEKYELGATGKNIFALFPDVQFYDYTKVPKRKVEGIKNYHLTFSQADGNEKDANWAISKNMNVTVVFDKIPAEYKGREVFNADDTDLRFLDPKGVVLGLKAKGRAKKDRSGFVVFMQQA